MSFDILNYKPEGDKKNSAYFEEYRHKIFERRTLKRNRRHARHHARRGDSGRYGRRAAYLGELYLMGPYRFSAAYISDTHHVYILTSQPEFPRLFVLEPLDRRTKTT